MNITVKVPRPTTLAGFLMLALVLAGGLRGQEGAGPSSADEARRAFDFLNAVRANPAAFSREIGVDLSGVKPLPPLVWDERLARSARKKAEDMARRNYFAHVDPDGNGPNLLARGEGYPLPAWWGTGRALNYIESISAGPASGKEHVRNLLNDGGAPHDRAGHRLHLLGMKEFWANHIHAGVGLAANPASTYRYYLVIHTGVPDEQKEKAKPGGTGAK